MTNEAKRGLAERLIEEVTGAVDTPRGARFMFNPPPPEIAHENCRRMWESLTAEERAELKRAAEDPDEGVDGEEVFKWFPELFGDAPGSR